MHGVSGGRNHTAVGGNVGNIMLFGSWRDRVRFQRQLYIYVRLLLHELGIKKRAMCRK